MARRKVLQGASVGATDIATAGDITAAIGTPVKGSGLPDVTGQSVDINLDNLWLRDKSNVTQDATNGSLSEVTPVELFGSANKVLSNSNTAQVINASGATDTYLTGSFIKWPNSSFPTLFTEYHCTFVVSKTAAGTATPVVTIRVGTAGSTADTARVTLTFGAGTAAIDRAVVEVIVNFRVVGASAVMQVMARATTNLTTTGWSNAVKALDARSSAFDVTTSSSGIGLSYNGGTGALHTVETVMARMDP